MRVDSTLSVSGLFIIILPADLMVIAHWRQFLNPKAKPDLNLKNDLLIRQAILCLSCDRT